MVDRQTVRETVIAIHKVMPLAWLKAAFNVKKDSASFINHSQTHRHTSKGRNLNCNLSLSKWTTYSLFYSSDEWQSTLTHAQWLKSLLCTFQGQLSLIIEFQAHSILHGTQSYSSSFFIGWMWQAFAFQYFNFWEDSNFQRPEKEMKPSVTH